MKRTCFRRGPFGLRVTPDDIRLCASFLARAARLMERGCPEPDRAPWSLWLLAVRPAAAYRRRS